MKSGFEDLFHLRNCSALVTGATGLLGREFCRGLAEFGANVAVVDLDTKMTADFAEELVREFGVKAVGIPADVSSPESVAQMAETARREFGGLDVLVNNAATKSRSLDAFFAPTEEFSLEAWREVMAVNLDGMFLVAQAVGRIMVGQGRGGSIIQTSSIYGLLGPDNSIYEGSFYLSRQINTPPIYSASKAGVVGLTKYLATYWAEKGIRVNCLVPGGVESGQNDEFRRRYANRIPLARMARAKEMVPALLYLASNASSYVTGQCVFVDGGLSAW